MLVLLQLHCKQVPLLYPFVEAFRLSMLAMSHVDFPFNVLGAVLARNSSRLARPLQLADRLTYWWVCCVCVCVWRGGGARKWRAGKDLSL